MCAVQAAKLERRYFFHRRQRRECLCSFSALAAAINGKIRVLLAIDSTTECVLYLILKIIDQFVLHQ